MFIHADYLEDELLPLELQKFQNFQIHRKVPQRCPNQNFFGGPSQSSLVRHSAPPDRVNVTVRKSMLRAMESHGL